MAGESDSLVTLLGELHDPVSPPPVSMWPATPAWWLLGALLLAALVLGAVAWRRHRRATAWRRAALGELAALAPALRTGDPEALAALQTLLRRVALATAPRAQVAPLTGAAWAAYIGEGGLRPFAAALADAPYRPAAYDGPALLAAARDWIRRRDPVGERHA